LRTIYTIGHSNHALEQFLELLHAHSIEVVNDVRSSPYSRYCPHFNQRELAAALARAGIVYEYLGKELGARPDDPTCYSNGRVSYQKLAARVEFAAGLARVHEASQTLRLALLCAEKDPLTCHRAILVGRSLRRMQVDTHHILADGTVETQGETEHRLCDLFKLAPNLFEGEAEIIERAYDRQAERIAYAREDLDPF
jgi:uncharacterized protein (DUF488 family)